MTVSLDSPLSGGAGEGRQRLQRAAARAVGFIGKMARNPLTAIGGGIIFMLLVVAIFAPLIAPYNPLVQDLNSALVAPNAQHWFGTDEFGRDIFSRLVYGSRITLYIVLLVSVTVGPLGYFHLLPESGPGASVCRRFRTGAGARGYRHHADRLAADCPSGARRNALSAPG